MELITELFDEDTTLPITNLNPKKKIPQIFSVHVDDAIEQPGFRLCTYTSGGDTNRDLKMGDKMMHIVPFTLTAKGSIAKLKGLGPSPINYINSVFTVAMQTMRQYKIDACLFRVLKSKTNGAARQMQVIADRLVRTKGAGRYVLLKEIWDYDKKYAYIMVYRKNANLEDIPGVPPISTELFTKVESKVGDVYVDVKTGNAVPKAVAVAASIALENDKRTDQAVIQKTKISRRLAAQAQYSTVDASLQGDSFAAKKYQEFESKVPVYKAEGPMNSGVIQIGSNFSKGAIGGMRSASRFKSSDYELESFRNHIALAHARLRDPSIKLQSDITYQGSQEYLKNKEFFDYKTDKILSDLADINISNSFDVIKKIINDLVKGSKATPDEKTAIIQFVMNGIYKLINESAAQAYEYASTEVTPKGLTQAESDVIEDYCADSYVEMNSFLLGKPDSTREEYMERDIKHIETLDSAFAKGSVLPPGTTLYRGQEVTFKTLRHNIENKMFYFKNFVSTSLKPNIFGEHGKNYMALDDSGAVFSGEGEGSVDAEDLMHMGSHSTYANEDAETSVGMVIKGAERIKVIVPGHLSGFPSEAEVILPRGILLKINKVSTYFMKETAYNKYLIEGTIVPPSEQLEESVYDGDHLMETGEVRPMAGFNQFLVEESKEEESEVSQILASLVNINGMSKKFKM